MPYPDQHFDLEDIPIDEDGNPIGKRTGFCEWCGKDILPLPTDYVLNTVWDRAPLYCCKQYQQMIEETAALEKALLHERKIYGELKSVSAEPKQVATLMVPEDEDQAKSLDEKRISKTPKLEVAKKPKGDALRLSKHVLALLEKRRHSYEEQLRVRKNDKGVDTFDLPWDPYETRYLHPNPFNDEIFDTPEFHLYYHPDIIMQASEIFNATEDHASETRGGDSEMLLSSGRQGSDLG